MNDSLETDSVASDELAKVDIAIVGGGMVGATIALLLAKALPAAKVLLLEAKRFEMQQTQGVHAVGDAQLGPSSFDGRSTALAPTTVHAMQSLGVWDAVRKVATEIACIRVSDKGHFAKTTFTKQDNDGEPLGFVVENRGLGLALMQGVQSQANIVLRAPINVTALKPRAGFAELQLSDGQNVQATLAIVADGADSPLRLALGIGETVTDYHQQALVMNVQTQLPHNNQAFERFTPNGPLAFLPVGGTGSHASAVVWTLPEAEAETVQHMDTDACLHYLQTQFGDWLGRIEKMGDRVLYPLKLRVAQEQIRSNIVLMGNAAHFLHPVAGQGFNLAVRDALKLIEVLSQVVLEDLGDIGALKTLQAYETCQQRDQDKTIALSNAFNQVFKHPSALVALLRNMAMSAVEHKPWVRDGFIRQLSGRAEPKAQLPWL